MGVSGGAKGALEGPSMMPGGTKASYDAIESLLTKMAAKVEDGPCVAYVGPGGSGHFVKTVHNGIEYGIEQILAEAYDLMKRVKGLNGVMFFAPNHVAGMQIITPTKVPNIEIINVSIEGTIRSGNKLKSIPIKRPALDKTSDKLPIRSQSVSSTIVTSTLQITIINKIKKIKIFLNLFFCR